VPCRWRKAISSPAGDQAGENEWSSSVTFSSSLPVASRMTTSEPNASVFVAAMYLPSGYHDGERYPGPVTALFAFVFGS